MNVKRDKKFAYSTNKQSFRYSFYVGEKQTNEIIYIESWAAANGLAGLSGV